MRNKKLISMLMLSAGFVACTQDEIVENGFAGIENQKDLVEDVILNVWKLLKIFLTAEILKLNRRVAGTLRDLSTAALFRFRTKKAVAVKNHSR